MRNWNKLLIVWLLTLLMSILAFQTSQSILTSTMLLLSGIAVIGIVIYRLGKYQKGNY